MLRALSNQKSSNGEPITINVIIGKAAIIDEDIKHQLQ
jgi:hypothetical protein